jgi:teichuronic acid biosynthesis glycosyltransferase TuaG
MRNNLVSIITPSYNSSKFIVECVDSVISQTFQNWEMIIIDDCSKDNSRDVISNFSEKDKRLKSIFLEENVGAAEARNIAIKQAKGKYIAFLDSDDIWIKDKLEKQITFMNDNNIAFSFTSYQPISEDGKIKYSVITAPNKMSYHSYLRNTIIGCLTVIIDKEKTGDFQMPNIRSSHDMALWLLIMKRGFSAYGLDENLAYYRIVSTSNTSKKWKAAKEVWDVYRKEEKLNVIYSTYCFIGYIFNAIKKRML